MRAHIFSYILNINKKVANREYIQFIQQQKNTANEKSRMRIDSWSRKKMHIQFVVDDFFLQFFSLSTSSYQFFLSFVPFYCVCAAKYLLLELFFYALARIRRYYDRSFCFLWYIKRQKIVFHHFFLLLMTNTLNFGFCAFFFFPFH